MPTVILLDVSLSMCHPLKLPDCPEPYEIRNLAVKGLSTLLDYMTTHCKLEFVSLIAFSSLWEVVVQFTRDYESVKSSLRNLETYDKTSIVKALNGATSVVMEEWGAGVPTQVVLVTDGGMDVGCPLKAALGKGLSQNTGQKGNEFNFPLPFPFPSKLHVVCINDPSYPNIQSSFTIYQRLIEINNGGGELFLPEQPISLKSVLQMFQKLADVHYKPFHGILSCGNLSSNVFLSPPPGTYTKINDFGSVNAEMSPEISICGFMDIGDVSSPPSFSRHLVLPIQTSMKDENRLSIKTEKDEAMEEDVTSEDGKQPSFCVLLHGSLKVEGMVAICHLGEDWYGMLYSWADSKKKSNLMLSTYEPGLDTIPWLGKFSDLGPEPPEENELASFPVKPTEKRSYAQNSVVWIKQSGLQADIQKILRHARKLPEKSQHFYKELNRLRRAALSIGFYELLEGMANILDRECTLLPGSAHPDAALQLTHSASALRSPSGQDYDTPVMPLRTKFSVDD